VEIERENEAEEAADVEKNEFVDVLWKLGHAALHDADKDEFIQSTINTFKEDDEQFGGDEDEKEATLLLSVVWDFMISQAHGEPNSEETKKAKNRLAQLLNNMAYDLI